MKRFLPLILLILFAAPNSPIADNVDNFAPVIPKALGSQCVKETQYMRENHMDFLFEKRDLVVLKGIRTTHDSFNNCLSCHAVTNIEGHVVSYDDSKHFCRPCHDFAAVKIDCFECHSSVPDQNIMIGISND